MSKNKKLKKNIPTNSGKALSYSIIVGLSIGVLVGTILLFIFDNLFYFGLSPILGLTLGLIIGSIFEGKSKPVVNKKIQKSRG